MTDSGKADAQNGQNATHLAANFTQEKAADSTIALIKPSDPSAIDAVGYSNDNENYYDDKTAAATPH
jgi:hypothetical protein